MDWTQDWQVMPSMWILTTDARGCVKQGFKAEDVDLAFSADDKAGMGDMETGLKGPVESQVRVLKFPGGSDSIARWSWGTVIFSES